MIAIELTVTGTKDEFDSFLIQYFFTRKEFRIRRNDVLSWGVEGIMCRWVSDTLIEANVFEDIVSKFPSLFVKYTWKSSTGKAGMYVGRQTLKVIEWQDLSEDDETCFRNH